jgi:hypothetical protein
MTMTEPWDEQQRDPPPGLFLLLSALQRLAFRAGEPGAWAAPLAKDPIAFLLDTVGEVVNVWTTAGELIYSNRAATDPPELDGPARPGVTSYRRDGRRFERRAIAFDAYRATCVIEVVRELQTTASPDSGATWQRDAGT